MLFGKRMTPIIRSSVVLYLYTETTHIHLQNISEINFEIERAYHHKKNKLMIVNFIIDVANNIYILL